MFTFSSFFARLSGTHCAERSTGLPATDGKSVYLQIEEAQNPRQRGVPALTGRSADIGNPVLGKTSPPRAVKSLHDLKAEADKKLGKNQCAAVDAERQDIKAFATAAQQPELRKVKTMSQNAKRAFLRGDLDAGNALLIEARKHLAPIKVEHRQRQECLNACARLLQEHRDLTSRSGGSNKVFLEIARGAIATAEAAYRRGDLVEGEEQLANAKAVIAQIDSYLRP